MSSIRLPTAHIIDFFQAALDPLGGGNDEDPGTAQDVDDGDNEAGDGDHDLHDAEGDAQENDTGTPPEVDALADDGPGADVGFGGDNDLPATVSDFIPQMPLLEHLSVSFADAPALIPLIRGQLLFFMVIGLLGGIIRKSPALRHVNATAVEWGDIFAVILKLPERLREKVEHILCGGLHLESWTFTEGIHGLDLDPLKPATIAAMQKLYPNLHDRGIVRLSRYDITSDRERLRVECEETTRTLNEGL